MIFDDLAAEYGAPHQPPDATYAIPIVPPPVPSATRYEPPPASPGCCCAEVLHRLDEIEQLIRGEAA